MRLAALRLALLAAVAIAIGWSALRAARARIDEAESDRYGGELGRLAALDARLNEGVLGARAGLVADYDRLADTTADLREVHREITTLPRYIDARDASALAAAIEASKGAGRDKERAVERFKSENAVLRNSVRFFPLETTRLIGRYEAVAAFRPLADVLRALDGEVLLFGLFPDAELAARVREDLGSLRDAARARQLEPEIENLARHVAIILDRTERVDDLTGAILAAPSSARIADVDASYSAAYSRAVAHSSHARSILFFVLLLGVVLSASEVFLRQRRAAREIQSGKGELERALAALERERARVVAADAMKSVFLATTSHELRTPLNAIIGFTRIVLRKAKGALPEKQIENLARVEQSGLSLLSLINDILDLSKVEAGRMEFHPEPLVLKEHLDELLLRLAPLAAEKKLELRLEVAEDTPEISADPQRVAQVVTNLVSNAIKFTSEGAVTVSAERSTRGARIRVRDTGRGISEDQLAQIFEPFHRIEEAGEDAAIGTGLGLAIVKRLANAMGAAIDVSSAVGHGTVFSFDLPRAAPAEENDGRSA